MKDNYETTTIDGEKAESFLLNFSDFVTGYEAKRFLTIEEINTLQDMLLKLTNSYFTYQGAERAEINKFIVSFLEPFYKKLLSAIESPKGFSSNAISKEFSNLNKIFVILQSSLKISIIGKPSNTEKFYKERISLLEEKTKLLENTLRQTEGKSQDEINQAKEEAEITRKELDVTKKELDLKKRQEDAKNNWKENIIITFIELENYLKPIKNEQNRLNTLFWVYLAFSGLLVIAIIIIECIAVHKVSISPTFPDFKEYITIYLPLPITGAMLWAFIYQMNRAQRQLIVIAKSIHKVEYVQGLLLSINKLAPTVEDGITRINAALDKLINNHLNEKEVNTEEDIIKEEKKDVVPVETIIRLLKEVKGVVGKE